MLEAALALSECEVAGQAAAGPCLPCGLQSLSSLIPYPDVFCISTLPAEIVCWDIPQSCCVTL